jgi:hypothetical protein
VEITFTTSTNSTNYRSSVRFSMGDKKLELTFWNGIIIATVLNIALASVVMDKFFVSKDVFKLGSIYIDGKIYKICRYK